MKHMIGDDTDLHSLGKILQEMGEYGQSRKCYERMMHDLQVRTADCHMGLGQAFTLERESDPALSHYEQAMKIRKEVFNPEHESVGEVYSCIGALQWYSLSDYDQALINLTKAIEIQESTLSSYSPALANTYHNLASTYDMIEKYDLASEYYKKALKIREAVLPPEHPLIASTYNNLGSMYEDKGDYTEALKFYQKSLEIIRKTLPPTHPNIVKTENGIRLVKEKIKK
jgi:tetratricopeptide (TPR) repeat protein